MGGGIAVLFLGSVVVWIIGLLPMFTALTLLFPRMFWLVRIVLGGVLSSIAVIIVWWATMAFRSGWIAGTYAIVAVAFTAASIFILLFRGLVQRN